MTETENLAEESDASRQELLEAIEDAGDLLADALRHANRHAKHDETRPSALMAFSNVEDAAIRLGDLDLTRSFDETRAESRTEESGGDDE